MSGISNRQKSGGYISPDVASGGGAGECSGTNSGGKGVRAHVARVAGSPSFSGIVSFGRDTAPGFVFGAGAGITGVVVGDTGRWFLPGPPSWALGGPPVLMLGCRLRETNDGPYGGCTGAPNTTPGEKLAWTRGDMGMPGGGWMPAAASARLGCGRCPGWTGRGGAPGGFTKKFCWIGVCSGGGLNGGAAWNPC